MQTPTFSVFLAAVNVFLATIIAVCSEFNRSFNKVLLSLF